MNGKDAFATTRQDALEAVRAGRIKITSTR